jgi:phospholipase A1
MEKTINCSTDFKSLFCRQLLGLFTGLVLVQATAQPVWLLSGPEQTLPAGSKCRFWLQCLNPSQGPVTLVFPASLPCRWQLGAQEIHGELAIGLAAEAEPVVIAGGSFVRRAYQGIVPPGMVGQIVVSVSFAGGEVSAAVVNARVSAPLDSPGQPGDREASPVVAKPPALEPPLQGGLARNSGGPLTNTNRSTDPDEFFRTHFFPYEPFYLIYGPESPNVKFQISFKYRLLLNTSQTVHSEPPWRDLYLGYSQTSLWDLNKPSAPFFDSSYRPELLYFHRDLIAPEKADWFKLDLQSGFKHESNGRDGDASRSLNIVYLNPSLNFGELTGWKFTLSPRAWTYVGDLSDNPNIANYRGNADLRTVLNWKQKAQLAAMVRVGNTFDHGSLQLDLTVPLRDLPLLRSSLFFYAQYFTGYGESLLHYDQRETQYRFGLGIFQ